MNENAKSQVAALADDLIAETPPAGPSPFIANHRAWDEAIDVAFSNPSGIHAPRGVREPGSRRDERLLRNRAPEQAPEQKRTLTPQQLRDAAYKALDKADEIEANSVTMEEPTDDEMAAMQEYLNEPERLAEETGIHPDYFEDDE